MKANLLASAAAALLTFATLGAVSHNLPAITTDHAAQPAVIDLAPVHVHASAAEMRAAALLTDGHADAAGQLTSSRVAGTAGSGPVRLLDSPLAMPYYSFGNTLGRVNKE